MDFVTAILEKDMTRNDKGQTKTGLLDFWIYAGKDAFSRRAAVIERGRGAAARMNSQSTQVDG